jgi:hypothetical protein
LAPKRVHLRKATTGLSYCGQQGDLTDDVELATCLNCLRFWRLAEQRQAQKGG